MSSTLRSRQVSQSMIEIEAQDALLQSYDGIDEWTKRDDDRDLKKTLNQLSEVRIVTKRLVQNKGFINESIIDESSPEQQGKQLNDQKVMVQTNFTQTDMESVKKELQVLNQTGKIINTSVVASVVNLNDSFEQSIVKKSDGTSQTRKNQNTEISEFDQELLEKSMQMIKLKTFFDGKYSNSRFKVYRNTQNSANYRTKNHNNNNETRYVNNNNFGTDFKDILVQEPVNQTNIIPEQTFIQISPQQNKFFDLESKYRSTYSTERFDDAVQQLMNGKSSKDATVDNIGPSLNDTANQIESVSQFTGESPTKTTILDNELTHKRARSKEQNYGPQEMLVKETLAETERHSNYMSDSKRSFDQANYASLKFQSVQGSNVLISLPLNKNLNQICTAQNAIVTPKKQGLISYCSYQNLALSGTPQIESERSKRRIHSNQGQIDPNQNYQITISQLKFRELMRENQRISIDYVSLPQRTQSQFQVLMNTSNPNPNYRTQSRSVGKNHSNLNSADNNRHPHSSSMKTLNGYSATSSNTVQTQTKRILYQSKSPEKSSSKQSNPVENNQFQKIPLHSFQVMRDETFYEQTNGTAATSSNFHHDNIIVSSVRYPYLQKEVGPMLNQSQSSKNYNTNQFSSTQALKFPINHPINQSDEKSRPQNGSREPFTNQNYFQNLYQ